MERRDFLKGLAAASGAFLLRRCTAHRPTGPRRSCWRRTTHLPGRRTIRGRARREFLPSPIRRNGMPRPAITTTRLRIRWPPSSGWGVSPAPGSR